ncbi:hypothetical protein L1887_14387 [Cichorium endivia]|nr:hypothetical protein L1887_14387 [Cichorium endivia]
MRQSPIDAYNIDNMPGYGASHEMGVSFSSAPYLLYFPDLPGSHGLRLLYLLDLITAQSDQMKNGTYQSFKRGHVLRSVPHCFKMKISHLENPFCRGIIISQFFIATKGVM